MAEISAAEAAERLHTTRQWVTTLLRRGSLTGRQLSSRAWVVDESSIGSRQLAAPGAGRAWSALASWALLSELAAEPFVHVSGTLRARVRSRIRSCDAETISRRVGSRTTWRSYTADDLAATAAKLTLTGPSAVDRLSRELTEQSSGTQGYVPEQEFDSFITDNWMIAGGNITIGTYPQGVHLAGRYAPDPVVAADLALSAVSRERSVALRELERMRSSWLASHTSRGSMMSSGCSPGR